MYVRNLLPTIRHLRGPARRDAPTDAGIGADGGGSGSTSDNRGDGGKDAGTGSKTPTISGDFDPERHARALAAAREGESKAKVAKKEADERLARVLAAAGLTPDGKQDPAEQLKAATAERDKATASARQTAVELAVYKAAGKAGADPDALLDSRAFLAAVADLDSGAADFADKVGAAITAAVKGNPRLGAGDSKTAPKPPGKSGGDFSAGNGGPGPITEAQLKQMSPDQIAEAMTAGKLAHLL